jgi:drug/metabolite transporter (DMT)-like permease
VGYGLYFAMLRLAPLSLVHTALTGGLVLFLLLSVFLLGEKAGVREWSGGLAVTAGLVCLGLSLDDEASTAPARADLWSFAVASVALAAVAVVLDRQPGRPIGTSIASGVVLGMAAVFAKLLAAASSLTEALSSSALWLTLGANIAGFALMQSALQNGRGVVVVPIFSVLSDLVPILAGVLVLHEGLPHEPAAAALRILAFGLAIGGTALLATATDPGLHPPSERSS